MLLKCYPQGWSLTLALESSKLTADILQQKIWLMVFTIFLDRALLFAHNRKYSREVKIKEKSEWFKVSSFRMAEKPNSYSSWVYVINDNFYDSYKKEKMREEV